MSTGQLTNLVSLQIHGNYFNGTIPQSLGNLKEVTILKLGRNPLTGQLPSFSFPKVIQFNCNFCAYVNCNCDFILGFILKLKDTALGGAPCHLR